MNTTARGRAAECLAADYLISHGFIIMGQNWRNRWCEIDLIAQSSRSLHIIEVKYRANIAYGYATEYISRDKMRRLMRAALAWVQAHEHHGPYQIDVIAVEGPIDTPEITYLPNVTSD